MIYDGRTYRVFARVIGIWEKSVTIVNSIGIEVHAYKKKRKNDTKQDYACTVSNHIKS